MVLIDKKILIALVLTIALVAADDCSNDDIEGHASDGSTDDDGAEDNNEHSSNDPFEVRTSRGKGQGYPSDGHNVNPAVNLAIASDKPTPRPSHHPTIINSFVDVKPVVDSAKSDSVAIGGDNYGQAELPASSCPQALDDIIHVASGYAPLAGDSSDAKVVSTHLFGDLALNVDDLTPDISITNPVVGNAAPGVKGVPSTTADIPQISGTIPPATVTSGVNPVSVGIPHTTGGVPTPILDGISHVTGGVPTPVTDGNSPVTYSALTPASGGMPHVTGGVHTVVGNFPPLAGSLPHATGFLPPATRGIAPCRYWCKTITGQYVCCQTPQQRIRKFGWCPPQRPICIPTRQGLPPPCNNDSECPGFDKCCFEGCLEQSICKPARFGQ